MPYGVSRPTGLTTKRYSWTMVLMRRGACKKKSNIIKIMVNRMVAGVIVELLQNAPGSLTKCFLLGPQWDLVEPYMSHSLAVIQLKLWSLKSDSFLSLRQEGTISMPGYRWLDQMACSPRLEIACQKAIRELVPVLFNAGRRHRIYMQQIKLVEP